MRLLLTAHQFLPEHFSGTEILTYTTAVELQRRGHEVLVFTGSPAAAGLRDDQRFDSYVYKGLRVERFLHAFVPMGGQSNVAEMEYDSHLVQRRFRDLLAREKPHIVHFFHLSRISSSPIPVCRELNIPAFMTPTDFWPVCPTCQLRLPGDAPCEGPDPDAANCVRHLALLQGSRAGWLFRRLPIALTRLAVRAVSRHAPGSLALAGMVQAVAKRKSTIIARINDLAKVFVPTRLMESVLARHGVQREKMCFCPFGIDLDTPGVPRAADAGDRLRIGFIGTLADHKGAHVLVQAVKALPALKVELKMYGNLEDYPAYVERLHAAADGDSRIVFCGTFPNADIGKIFAGIDVLVVPSVWHENTPLVISSAQACGCPVVASDLGGISEAVRHEQNGLLFPAGDSGALGAALCRLDQDRVLLRRLGESSRKPRSILDYVDQIEDAYQASMSRVFSPP
jgi:glycosyltransferase involved in cell wall biosynthesis